MPRVPTRPAIGGRRRIRRRLERGEELKDGAPREISRQVQQHEEATLRAFIAPSRRNRYVESMRSKRRAKTVAGFYHFGDLDPRFATQLDSKHTQPKTLERLLRAKGAPDRCYVMSAHTDLDAREMDLSAALEAVAAGSVGTFISCIPGRLAYFEGETPTDRYILERKEG